MPYWPLLLDGGRSLWSARRMMRGPNRLVFGAVSGLGIGCGPLAGDGVVTATDKRVSSHISAQRSADAGTTYTLRTQLDGNRCLSLADGGHEGGSPVVLLTCDGRPQQNWTLVDGQMRTAGQLCLAPQGGNQVDGSKLVVAQCASDKHRWARRSNQLVLSDTYCVDLPGGNLASGTEVQIWRCGDSVNQQWQWPPVAADAAAPASTQGAQSDAMPASAPPATSSIAAQTSSQHTAAASAAPASAADSAATSKDGKPDSSTNDAAPANAVVAASSEAPDNTSKLCTPQPAPAEPAADAASASATASAKPVAAGQHGLRPSVGSKATLEATVAFYQAWKGAYLTAGECGDGQLYVAHHGNASRSPSISVSEGIGWGMLALALMHQHDPQAQQQFDAILRFVHAHPSKAGSGLMAWDIQAPCQSAPDASSATDADLDIAFALLAADRAWGSGGQVHYRDEAKAVIDALMNTEVNQEGHFLSLWENIAAGSQFYGVTRVSDLMMSHLRAFASATGDKRWLEVVERGYEMVAGLQAQSGSGLLPDFAVDAHQQARIPSGKVLEKDGDGTYSWNACRIPWRLGVDFMLSNEPRAASAVNKMVSTLKATAGADPTKLGCGYQLDGTCDSQGNSLAFLAPVAVGAVADPNGQAWLDALWQVMVDRPVDGEQYYGNTIKLLSMIALSDLWIQL